MCHPVTFKPFISALNNLKILSTYAEIRLAQALLIVV